MPYIGNIVQDFSVNTAMLNTDSVTSIKIDDGTIVNADINDSAAIAMSKLALSITNSEVNASAAIAGTKISPDFGSQVITTTGNIMASGGFLGVNGTGPQIQLNDTDSENDFEIQNDNGIFKVRDIDAGSDRLIINSAGNTTFAGNLNANSGLDVTGDITTTSGNLTVDGTGSVEDVFKISDVAGGQRLLMGNRDSAGVDCPRIFNVGNAALTIGIGDSWSGDGGTLTNQFNIAKNGTITSYGNHDFGAGIDVTGDITATGDINLVNNGTLFGGDDAANTLILRSASGNVNHSRIDIGVSEGSDNGGVHFYTAGSSVATRAMTIKGTTQNVGIGTTTPDTNLVVSSGDHTGITIESTRTGATDNIGSLQFQSGNTDVALIQTLVNGTIKFRNTSGLTDRVHIDHNGTLLSFSTNDTTPNIKWRSDDTNWFGSLNQSVEGATISTFLSTGGDWSANGTTYSATKAIASFETRAIVLHPQFNNGAGKVAFLQKAAGSTTTDGTVTEILKIDNDGIKFGSDTAADNALDDYEEGTWTPTFNNAGGFGTNNTVGKYTKIGRVVHWVCQVAVVRNTSSSSGTFTISGLPFTALNGATGGHGYAGCMGALFNWNIPDTAYQIGIRVPDNNSFIQFFANFDNAADSQLTSPFDANKTIFGSLAGTYIT